MNQRHKPNRNEPCPCGSGKKFKKCCAHEETSTEKLLNAKVIPPGKLSSFLPFGALTSASSSVPETPTTPEHRHKGEHSSDIQPPLHEENEAKPPEETPKET